jgi:hypothetical protein
VMTRSPSLLMGRGCRPSAGLGRRVAQQSRFAAVSSVAARTVRAVRHDRLWACLGIARSMGAGRVEAIGIRVAGTDGTGRSPVPCAGDGTRKLAGRSRCGAVRLVLESIGSHTGSGSERDPGAVGPRTGA